MILDLCFNEKLIQKIIKHSFRIFKPVKQFSEKEIKLSGIYYFDENKKKYDYNGILASKGKPNNNILNLKMFI